MMTESFRATATAERLKPIFSRSLIPQFAQITLTPTAGQGHDGGFIKK